MDDTNVTPVTNTPPQSAPPTNSPPPPPSGGTPVANPNYRPQTPTPASGNGNGNGSIPPPPSGGTPVPNPAYRPPLPTTNANDQSIPAFIRNSIDMSKVRTDMTAPVKGQDDGAQADVHSDDPLHIRVFAPNAYTPDMRNHELTHVYQYSRGSNEGAAAETTAPAYRSAHNDPYDYSGGATSANYLPTEQQMPAKIKGLVKARNSGKTIADFNIEQQADMVKDYKQQHDAFLTKVKNGTATKKDLQSMSDLQNAYHPFIQQLANQPGRSNQVVTLLRTLTGIGMPTINTRPDAPGLPSFATPGLGVVTADPLMGGRSQAIRNRTRTN